MTEPDARLSRVRTVARLLDNAVKIPGTSARIGLDPLIGLVPGLGDFASAAMSGYIVLEGIRLGAPRSVVYRMIANVALDTLVGSVPFLGDLFDAGWKSNARNVGLLERHFTTDVTARRGSRLAMIVGVVLMAALAVGGLMLAFVIFQWLMGRLG